MDKSTNVFILGILLIANLFVLADKYDKRKTLEIQQFHLQRMREIELTNTSVVRYENTCITSSGAKG